MNERTNPNKTDPRIRRTRGRICKALSRLLQEKEFSEISITDLTKRADVARVTFYQHFDNKEAVLLMLVSNFFEQRFQLLNPMMIQQAIETGELGAMTDGLPALLADSAQLRQIHVALKHLSSDVRRLAVNSFLQVYERGDFVDNDVEARLLATYHVSGVLALLESFLDGDLPITPSAFRRTTFVLLRTMVAHLMQNGVLKQTLTAQE